jgi:hypothetical protein
LAQLLTLLQRCSCCPATVHHLGVVWRNPDAQTKNIKLLSWSTYRSFPKLPVPCACAATCSSRSVAKLLLTLGELAWFPNGCAVGRLSWWALNSCPATICVVATSSHESLTPVLHRGRLPEFTLEHSSPANMPVLGQSWLPAASMYMGDAYTGDALTSTPPTHYTSEHRPKRE